MLKRVSSELRNTVKLSLSKLVSALTSGDRWLSRFTRTEVAMKMNWGRRYRIFNEWSQLNRCRLIKRCRTVLSPA